MSVEQHHGQAPPRHAAPHTYIVGRRPFEDPEIYVVSATAVERLRSARPDAGASLDWHGRSSVQMELSELVISRVAGQRPSRRLATAFVLYVLAHLPHGGFVLDSEEVSGWLWLASDPEDFAPEPARKRSITSRLRGLFGGPAIHGTNA
jgi:hypothetical protein